MKKIVFKTISIQNFLSIGTPPLKLSLLKGINLITGENLDNGTRNGVGKSSLIEAIYWCIFGSTIRDIKNDKIIHNQLKKDCEVTLTFDIHQNNQKYNSYTIRRSLGPSKIQILLNGDDITQSTIPANDLYIKELLNGNEELFKNAVIMTANNTLPFMAQKKIDKRKFLEGVFNLNIFTDMLLKSRSDFNDVKKQNDLLCNSFLNEQKNLEIFEKQSQKYNQQKNEKIKSFNDSIDNINNKIKELNQQNINVDDIVLKITKHKEKKDQLNVLLESKDNQLNELTNQHNEIKFKLDQLSKEKNSLIQKKDSCPVCKRKYSQDEVEIVTEAINEIEKNILELTVNKTEIYNNIQKQNTKKAEIKTAIITIENKITDFDKVKNSILLKDEKIKNFNEQIKQYEKFIADLNVEVNPSDEEIKKIKTNIIKLENDLKKVKKELSILESIKFILSEEGVKSFIIKKLLDILNQKLNFYLKKLDAPCTCTFNEQFEETILNNNGKECSYFNFSGGERKRIDIAILFMFQDILRIYSGTFYSLSMYDELFDSAIDEAGTNKILEILKQRVEEYDESVYIVSHNKSSLKNSFDHILRLQKSKGQTIIQS